jgi:hypothetical protein
MAEGLAFTAETLSDTRTETQPDTRSELQTDQLWIKAEQHLARKFNGEKARTSGLIAAKKMRWSAAVLRLKAAAEAGLTDIQVLDSLGEAAYRAKVLEVLLPFRRHYAQPVLATHFARALLILGRGKEARQWLQMARPSVLKSSLERLVGFKGDIEKALAALCADEYTADEFSELDFPMYWQALAAAADVTNRRDLLKAAEERTCALDYRNPVTHFNRAVRFLQDGDLRAGWRLYDWRLWPGSQCALPTLFCGIPFWQGQNLKGKSIAVWTEFGFGDQIFSLRFVHELMKVCDDVHILPCAELYDLVRASFPDAKVHRREDLNRLQPWPYTSPEPDFWCYAHSLAYRLRCFDYVGRAAYLSAAPSEAPLTKVFAQLKSSALPTCSITWHGDVLTAPMRTRAYTVDEFLRESGVLKQPHTVLSLQKDIRPEEAQTAKTMVEQSGGQWLDASPHLNSFADTAAWLQAVDQVYSCDTAMAHLSGALGQPTKVLIRNKAPWQWRVSEETASDEGGKSRWYDSADVLYRLLPKVSFMFDVPEDDEPQR